MFRSIRWRIAIPYVGLIIFVMSGLVIYLSDLVRDIHLANLEDQLTSMARMVGERMTDPLTRSNPGAAFDAEARHYAALVGARVTLIGMDGVVLGESHQDRAKMDNHLYRPEVQQALIEGYGIIARFSRTMGYEMMYVALPIVADDGREVGIARVALPLSQVEESVVHLRRAILSAALLAALVATVLAIYIAERTTRPVHRLTTVVQQMAQGDLGMRLLPVTHDEVGVLTRAFNEMSDRLRGTISTLVEERGRLTAVLDSMADGVLITDGEGRVRLINPAAVRLLDTDEELALGRPFAQVARDHRIIALWQQCYEQNEEQFESVEVGRQGPFFQAIATPLRDAGPQATLVILQDLTRIRRLETVRRDFISNISHELRTPLASLKALTETLRDGALEDPPAAHRFLERMETEVDALTQMVRELLELSRIESGQVPFRLETVDVADVMRPPVERLRPQAERADLQLIIELPPHLPSVLADTERMRQVITNLVHNAIKFTPPGGHVQVTASHVHIASSSVIRTQALDVEIERLTPGDWVLITVEDTGVGIPSDDLSRIFERFYKADRARSGGGTGLGLSIAKHIVHAHDGHIWVESIEGKGSIFCVALPVLTFC